MLSNIIGPDPNLCLAQLVTYVMYEIGSFCQNLYALQKSWSS